MNKCKKYRIQKWLFNTSEVYTPQIKQYFLWRDLIEGFDIFRGFVDSENKARDIINKDKQNKLGIEQYKQKCKTARAKFKPETICVE